MKLTSKNKIRCTKLSFFSEKEDEMGGTCGMYRGEKKCTKDFVVEN
jgi:hypothetical protein